MFVTHPLSLEDYQEEERKNISPPQSLFQIYSIMSVLQRL